MQRKYVYFFGGGRAEGSARMKSLLGSKGANLAEMTNIGTPVPPGFTISTEACTHYCANDGRYLDGLEDEIDETPLAANRLIWGGFPCVVHVPKETPP